MIIGDPIEGTKVGVEIKELFKCNCIESFPRQLDTVWPDWAIGRYKGI